MDKQAISFVMGNRLKELREERGLSHDKLIKQLNERYGISVSRDSVMAYEISDNSRAKASKLPNMGMRVETLYCLADFYGVSLDYLLGKTDVRTPDCTVQSICNYTGLSQDAVQTLHEGCTRQSPYAILFTIEQMLRRKHSQFYNSFAWRGAVAECTWIKAIERDRNEIESSFPGLSWDEYHETDTYRAIVARRNNRREETDRKLLEEVQKPIEEINEKIEIDARSASALYKGRAFKQVEIAMEYGYQAYVDEIMKIVLGEKYEKIMQRGKKFSNERKKK